MKTFVAAAVAACTTLFANNALACGGPVGSMIAVTTDGTRYTVTNLGKKQVTVTFTAWGQTFQLILAPGQSGTPATSGPPSQLMRGYQTCYAAVQGN